MNIIPSGIITTKRLDFLNIKFMNNCKCLKYTFIANNGTLSNELLYQINVLTQSARHPLSYHCPLTSRLNYL